MIFNYASGKDESHRCPRCGSRRISDDGHFAHLLLGRLLRCSWCGFFWGEPDAGD